jgi:hypothetical protein
MIKCDWVSLNSLNVRMTFKSIRQAKFKFEYTCRKLWEAKFATQDGRSVVAKIG